MRKLVELACRGLHHTWGWPVWNRSVLLTCPIMWACHRYPKFDAWFYGPNPEKE